MLAQTKSIHEKLTLQLMEYISLGVYQPEERLPSVRELSSIYRVNPHTISKVYANLEADGYVYAIPAKGYYVAKPDERNVAKARQDLEEMAKMIFILSRLAGMDCQEVTSLVEKAFRKGEVEND